MEINPKINELNKEFQEKIDSNIFTDVDIENLAFTGYVALKQLIANKQSTTGDEAHEN